ncbi:MAG: prepilin-type N-terminal cleavage/methylation domain-containing protein [Pseudomonadota bacterium]
MRSDTTTQSSSSGFTFVEVLMTMLLLTIVLVGLASLQVFTIREVTGSQRTSSALRLGQAMIEHWKINHFALSADTDWTIQTNQNNSEMKNVGVNGVSPGPFTVERFIEAVPGMPLYRISIRVSWQALQRDTQNNYQTENLVVSTMARP